MLNFAVRQMEVRAVRRHFATMHPSTAESLVKTWTFLRINQGSATQARLGSRLRAERLISWTREGVRVVTFGVIGLFLVPDGIDCQSIWQRFPMRAQIAQVISF